MFSKGSVHHHQLEEHSERQVWSGIPFTRLQLVKYQFEAWLNLCCNQLYIWLIFKCLKGVRIQIFWQKWTLQRLKRNLCCFFNLENEPLICLFPFSLCLSPKHIGEIVLIGDVFKITFELSNNILKWPNYTWIFC